LHGGEIGSGIEEVVGSIPSGSTNYIKRLSVRTDGRVPGKRRVSAIRARHASKPIDGHRGRAPYYVGPGAPSFHIQHGALDRLVPIRQSEAFHAALLKAGADSTLVRIEGADHCFWGAPLDGIVERDIAFLKAQLFK
jgi:acetyl esterase/lipase